MKGRTIRQRFLITVNTLKTDDVLGEMINLISSFNETYLLSKCIQRTTYSPMDLWVVIEFSVDVTKDELKLFSSCLELFFVRITVNRAFKRYVYNAFWCANKNKMCLRDCTFWTLSPHGHSNFSLFIAQIANGCM